MSIRIIRSAVVALYLLAVASVCAQDARTANLHKSSRPTRSGEDPKLDAILEELKQIRELLAEQNKYMHEHAAAAAGDSAPSPVLEKVSVALSSGWYSLGSDTAPVTMMEFADLQCPYCRRFQSESFAELRKNYIDTGKLRFVSRDLPLDFHAHSMDAALATRCAGEQNKYWDLRESLILNAKDFSADSISKYAEQAGLDMSRFRVCVELQKYKAEIEKDREEAARLGFSGTPSFVIGRTVSDRLEGVKIVGALPYKTFDAEINKQLAAKAQ